MGLLVGIDLVDVDDVRQSVSEHGERYLSRVYDRRERRECNDDPRRLAARFAAKEAAIKALGVEHGLAWRSIATVAGARGGLSLELDGAAAELGRLRAVTSLTVSISHRDSVAGAIVLATTREGADD